MSSGDIFKQEAELKQLAEDYFGTSEKLDLEQRLETIKVMVSAIAGLLIEKEVFTQEEFQDYVSQNMQYLVLLKNKRAAQQGKNFNP